MLKVTERAAQFYKNEMDLENGDSIRLFVRYGGGGIDGFTLGVDKGQADPSNVKVTVEGVSFYNNPEDDWLIDQAMIDTDDSKEDIHFSFDH